MAVDVCSEFSTSPRISFSHDLKELDFVPVETSHALFSNPTIDFDFCVGQNPPPEISSADELFADGRILPIQIKKPKPVSPVTRKNTVVETAKKKRLIEFLSFDADGDEEEKPPAKPFWQFRRSSSENGGPNGLLRFLTRSNSTGSVPNNQKPLSASAKAMQKQRSLKEPSVTNRNCAANSLSSLSYFSHYCNNGDLLRNPSLRKSGSRSSYGGNGVRINPVLNINIPSAYIAKGTVSLFGIGSFFRSKKSKKKRK